MSGPYPNMQGGIAAGVASPTYAGGEASQSYAEALVSIEGEIGRLIGLTDLAGVILNRLQPQPSNVESNDVAKMPVGLVAISFDMHYRLRSLNNTLDARLKAIQEAIG